MSARRLFMKKHAVPIYFILTFLFTWGCMAIAVYPGGFPISEEHFETSGALVYMAMLVGPSGAGILLTGLTDGRAGFRKLLSRLFTWRVGAGWYAVSLLTAPFLITAVLTGLSLVSAQFQPAILLSSEKTGMLLSSIATGLAVGFFEELGWTGFAVPGLKRRSGVVESGIILGLVWGAWHFVPFWKSDTFSSAFPLILLLAQLFSWLPPYRILMVWVYDRTESLLLSVLMHASLVASLGMFVPATLSGTSLLTWILTWALALWIIVAAFALARRKYLSQQPAREQTA